MASGLLFCPLVPDGWVGRPPRPPGKGLTSSRAWRDDIAAVSTAMITVRRRPDLIGISALARTRSANARR